MSNQSLVVTELDFDTIKNNLKNFLRNQSEFQDYDFEGGGLNILLDILAYNTHYNAYYLNMVANESFLDSAVLRDSVVSHAKTLGYTPYSASAPKATINLTFDGSVTDDSTLTLRRGFSFKSNPIDQRAYNYVLLNETTVTKANNNFYFENLDIYEGILTTYNFVYNDETNPKAIFTLPESNIDTRTLTVRISDSISNTAFETYEIVDDITNLNADSKAFFLQESKNGKYQIYFGDNIIGKKPNNQSVITVEYLLTNGAASNKSSNFIVSDPLQSNLNSTNYTIQVLSASSGGGVRESVDSIKRAAPIQYTSQDRLVSVKDYENYILRKYTNIDSISVWGGENEVPPIYGKVFISIKPSDGYFLSETEKQKIIDEIISPKSVIVVQNEFRDPEYLYLNLSLNVQYDPKKSSYRPDGLKTAIRESVLFYKSVNLEKFNAKFAVSKLQESVDNTERNSILGSEAIIRAQKRFFPVLNVKNNYTLNYSSSLLQGTPLNRLLSTEFNILDVNGTERRVFIEEIPKSFTGINSIELSQAGSNYTSEPTVTITGDGFGATAKAIVSSGRIQRIEVVNPGIDYNKAVVTISGGGGFGASAVAVIDSKIGKLRAVYYTSEAERVIAIPEIGTVNYETGVVQINDLKIVSSTLSDGSIRISCGLQNNIIQSNKNTIITIDEEDSASISINLFPV